MPSPPISRNVCIGSAVATRMSILQTDRADLRARKASDRAPALRRRWPQQRRAQADSCTMERLRIGLPRLRRQRISIEQEMADCLLHQEWALSQDSPTAQPDVVVPERENDKLTERSSTRRWFSITRCS